MAKRSVISDEVLLKGAEAIAADMQGPEGQRLKLARVIDVHLDWFDQARRRGLEWNDIVALLFRAGATRSDGRPLSRGHLQSLVWRKQPAERQPTEAKPTRNDATPMITKPTARSPATGQSIKPARGRKPQPAEGTLAFSGALPKPPAAGAGPDGIPAAQPEGDALLAYMKRAARLRREE
ncbi:hypothetical protein [Bosea sp. TND4EK4]|uniref:hypothetical protein n=1 Tax=Bosea sp. TND4EK4 TaxID=1907408 RepID=UPI000956D75E|nr:hypothetical protein [Bosea sp. TND4EK4]SIQ83168.1 hypothetical protein SAMN05880592_1066 [Bosea sp. TND4EK4]